MFFVALFWKFTSVSARPQNPTKIHPGQIQASKKQINPKNRMIAFWKSQSIHYESFHHHHHHHQSSSKDLIVMAIKYYQFSSMAIKYHHKFSFMAIIKCIIFPMNPAIWVPITPAFLMALICPPSAFAVPSGRMQIRRFFSMSNELQLFFCCEYLEDDPMTSKWLITMINKSEDVKLSPNISGT